MLELSKNRFLKYFSLFLIFFIFLNLSFAFNYPIVNNSQFYIDTINYNEITNNFKDILKEEYTNYSLDKLNENKEYQILLMLKKNSLFDFDFFNKTLENLNSQFEMNLYLRDDSILKFYFVDDLNKVINVFIENDEGSLILQKNNSGITFSNDSIKIKGNINNFNLEQINYINSDESINFSFLQNSIYLDDEFSGKYIHESILTNFSLTLFEKSFYNIYSVEPLNFLEYFDNKSIKSEELLYNDLVLVAEKYSIDRNLFIMSYMESYGVDILSKTDNVYNDEVQIDLRNYYNLDNSYLILEKANKLVNKGYLNQEYLYYFYLPLFNISENISHKDFIEIQGAFFKDDIDYIQIGDYNFYKDLSNQNKLFVEYLSYIYNEIQVRKMLSQENFFFGLENEFKYYKKLSNNDDLNKFKQYLKLQNSSLLNNFYEVLGGMQLLELKNDVVDTKSDKKLTL